MSNIYVNLTQAAGGVETNGYLYGDDARDRAIAASKLTPVATLTRANTISLANDIIIINDGTYLEPDYINVAKTELTIRAENNNQAIIQQHSSTVRVLHTTQPLLTIDGIILDAEDTIEKCITTGTDVDMVVNIIGGTLRNPTDYFILSTRHNSLIMNGGWIAEANLLSAEGILMSYSATLCTAGAISISDGTMTITDQAAGRSGIRVANSKIDPLVGCSCEIFNVTQDISEVTAANVQTGISVNGLDSINIYNNSITFNDSTASTGIVVDVFTTNDTNTVNIYNNTVVAPSGSPAGMGIQCGSNEPTTIGANSLKNARIFNNTVTGSNHGIFVGRITDAKMYANLAIDNTLSCLAKGSTTCKIAGNVIIDCIGNGAILAKGDTDSIFANNLVITNSGVTTIAMISARESEDLIQSTGTIYANNILFNNGGTVTKLVNYIVNQTATFFNNNYYSNDVIPANSWVYAGNNIAVFGAWVAHAQTTDESNTDPALDGYEQTASSLLGTGYIWDTNAGLLTSYGGEPFPAFNIDVGAVQTTDATNHPFHPVNL